MRRRRPLKNASAEAALFRMRAAVGFALVLLALGGLAAWYFRLQVLQHEDYATRSEANRVRLRPVVPARGLILDRKGRVLAENVPAWRLDVVPEQAGDPKVLLAALSKVVALSPDDIEKFEDARHASRRSSLQSAFRSSWSTSGCSGRGRRRSISRRRTARWIWTSCAMC